MPSTLVDSDRVRVMYNEFPDELEFAAECGFDAICVNEHHANGYGMMASPNLIASALARRTKEAVICVLGNLIALYNPPKRVAEEMAMLDCISGGRVISGFPVGSPWTPATPMASIRACWAIGDLPSIR
jgi:alkanesulfonate monooxygenase SsuD/methylene tetrahydromethanopterin reductase-like flavin-dependent oxidoreductase (luciferase family)